jgi:Na+-transporting NADH:ubiquinone oxidoreductase subunit B
MCLIGAVILIATGAGSWKIIVSVFAGAYLMGLFMNLVGGNAFVEMLPAHYHLVMGGLGIWCCVHGYRSGNGNAQPNRVNGFMDLLIGLFTVLIRVFNPAYPEGIMLAILLMNVFAPLIDYFVVSANKKRRLQRATV